MKKRAVNFRKTSFRARVSASYLSTIRVLFPRVKVELIQLTRFTTVRALVTSFLFFINFFNYFGNANMVPVSVIVAMKDSSLNKMKNSFV